MSDKTMTAALNKLAKWRKFFASWQLDHDYEESYPGWRSLPDGLSMKLPEAAETMRKLGFPP